MVRVNPNHPYNYDNTAQCPAPNDSSKAFYHALLTPPLLLIRCQTREKVLYVECFIQYSG